MSDVIRIALVSIDMDDEVGERKKKREGDHSYSSCRANAELPKTNLFKVWDHPNSLIN